MKLPRRRFLHLAAGAAALPAVLRVARAQTYPMRPVHILVGFAAGATTDIAARLIGHCRSGWAKPLSLRRARCWQTCGDRSSRPCSSRWLHASNGHGSNAITNKSLI